MFDKRFQDVVTSEEDMRSVIGHPNERVIKKVLDRLDTHSQAFIESSPFLVIASGDAQNGLDVSPKGDPSGFVHVLDDKTLAIPDRLGNRRADTLLNILRNSQIGLLFLVPGKEETLRINGHAALVRDQSVREPLAVNGKLPDFAIVVSVDQVYMHCAKCMIRSHLWMPERWPDRSGLASLAQALVEQGQLHESVQEMEAILANDKITRLY